MPTNTGLGTTLAVPNGWVTTLIGMDGINFRSERIDDTNLASTNYMRYIHSAIVDHDEFSAQIEFEVGGFATELTNGAGFTGDAGTITITFPLTATGAAVNAVIAGSGFVTGFTTPEISANGKLVANITCSFDGSSFTFTSQS